MKKSRFPKSVLPMYIWTVLLIIVPLCYILVLSFTTSSQTHGFVWQFTLDNYKKLADPVYVNVLLRSLRLAAETTLFTFVLGYPFAYSMSKFSGRTKKIIMLLIIIPFWTNSLLRMSGIITLFSTNGVINHLFLSMGIIENPMEMLYTYWITVLGMVYSLIPFMILPCYSSCEKLDGALREASRDLGAGRMRTFFKISLPITLPGILSGCVLVFVPSVGIYFITDLLGGANVMTIGNLIDKQIHGARNLPFAATLSLVMLIMAVFFILLYRRFTGNSELEGI